MARIDMNENIVTRKFLTKIIANEINTNYSIIALKLAYMYHMDILYCTASKKIGPSNYSAPFTE